MMAHARRHLCLITAHSKRDNSGGHVIGDDLEHLCQLVEVKACLDSNDGSLYCNNYGLPSLASRPGEKNMNLTVPGFSSEEKKQGKPSASDLHKKRMDMVRALMESSQAEANANNAKEMPQQGFGGNQAGASHPIRPSPSSEQLQSQSTGSQMMQQMTRF